jgi:hypothetical protein
VAEAAADERAEPTCQNSQESVSRAPPDVGSSTPNFSARCIRIAPDLNTRNGSGPLRSTSAGILELGLMSTKPEENWSLSKILISQASYSASLKPSASSSSSMIVAFWPLGVPSE